MTKRDAVNEQSPKPCGLGWLGYTERGCGEPGRHHRCASDDAQDSHHLHACECGSTYATWPTGAGAEALFAALFGGAEPPRVGGPYTHTYTPSWPEPTRWQRIKARLRRRDPYAPPPAFTHTAFIGSVNDVSVKPFDVAEARRKFEQWKDGK